MFWADQFQDERICLLALEGRLSGVDLANLSERLRGLAARGVSQVVVDLRSVEHWDYRGLESLAEAVRVRRRQGGSTAFVTPSAYLRDIATAAGVIEDLEFFDLLQLEGVKSQLTLVEAPDMLEEELLRKATGL